jgi:hypothetical protein
MYKIKLINIKGEIKNLIKMSDDKDENLQSVEASNENVKIIYKRPEYIIESQKKYYYKKKCSDPEFMVKKKLSVQKYREENRARVNELARLRRRRKKEDARKSAAVESVDERSTNVAVADILIEKLEKLIEIKD